jgi:hypothetical protein
MFDIDVFQRVHSHAAAALINFCEGVERDTLLPYLDPIVERLLKLLNNPAGNPPMVRRYVQEQAITTLAMVADASEVTFGKVRRRLNLFPLQWFNLICSITLLSCRCS